MDGTVLQAAAEKYVFLNVHISDHRQDIEVANISGHRQDIEPPLQAICEKKSRKNVNFFEKEIFFIFKVNFLSHILNHNSLLFH